MLSYLKEDQNKPDKNAETRAQTSDNAAAQSPQVDSEQQISTEEDYLVPAEHGKNLKHSTLMLLVISVIGGLVVWFMIKKTTPPPAEAAVSPEEQQIELLLAQLAGIQTEINDNVGDVDNVINKFDPLTNIEQVGVHELKKNPFRRDMTLGNEEEAPSPEEQMDLKRREVAERAKTLQLWSIMADGKGGGCCMINEKLYNLGDTVNNFKIIKITDRYVELTSNGITVQLKMM